MLQVIHLLFLLSQGYMIEIPIFCYPQSGLDYDLQSTYPIQAKLELDNGDYFKLGLDITYPYTWIDFNTVAEKSAQNEYYQSQSHIYYNQTAHITLQQGDQYVSGYLTKEDIGFKNEELIGFQYISAYYVEGFENYMVDGVLGLGFDTIGFSNSLDSTLNLLQKDEIIRNKTLAVYLGIDQKQHESRLFINDYSLDYFYNEPIWMKAQKDTGYWSFVLNQIKIGGYNIQQSPILVLFDTKNTQTTLPKATYTQIVEIIQQNHECVLKETGLICQCSDDEYSRFQTIELQIDEKSVLLPPPAYIRKIYSQCEIQLSPHNNEKILTIGSFFLTYYFVIFDQNTYEMGLAQNINYPNQLNAENYQFISYVLLGTSVTSFGAYIVIAYVRKNKEDNNFYILF